MVQYKSKVDIVYDLLIDNIANGIYKPGDRLVISQIAKENQVSEIPVREAIRRLESEGYAEIYPNQGAVICQFNNERIMQIFQIKGVLEGYASRLSIDYLTSKDFKELRNKNEQLMHAYEKSNTKKYSDLNMQFHLTVYKCIPEKELYNMITDLWRKWGITKSVFTISPERARESHLEHEEIIKLLEEKQYDAVEMAVRNHKFKAGLQFVGSGNKNATHQQNENVILE